MLAKERYTDWVATPSWKYLRRINFEISSVCNLACKYCSLKKNNSKPPFIAVNLVEKVLQELVAERVPIAEIGLYFSGESLLHPQFMEILCKTGKALDGFENNPRVYLHTNGTLWTDDSIDEVLSAGVLDRVIFSIDGVDASSFERMRKGAQYHVVTDAFRKLAKKARGKANVCINNLVDAESLKKQTSPDMLELFALADHVTTNYPYDLSEGGSHGFYRHKNTDSFCWYILDTLIVCSDARVSLCCVDLNANNAFGDLNKQTLGDVYFGMEHKRLLKLFAENRRKEIPGCAVCTVTDTDLGFPFGEPIQDIPQW